MQIEHIFQVFNSHRVDYILIGGMNFLLKHKGPLTYDIDFFVEDTDSNRGRLCEALHELKCQWGPSDQSWRPVGLDARWLTTQSVFCLTSPFGAIDVFRSVKGLEDGYAACRRRAELRKTPCGIEYPGLSDADMLRCQEVLAEGDRKQDRIDFYKRAGNL